MLLGSQGLIHFGLGLKILRTYEENVLMHARVMIEPLLCIWIISVHKDCRRDEILTFGQQSH